MRESEQHKEANKMLRSPCPFCKSTETKVVQSFGGMNDSPAYVACRGCGAQGSTDYDERIAVELWNRWNKG